MCMFAANSFIINLKTNETHETVTDVFSLAESVVFMSTRGIE